MDTGRINSMMNQQELEQRYEEVRRHNRRRRRARQQKRRRRQLIQLGVTGAVFCMLLIGGFAFYRTVAPPPAEEAAPETQDTPAQTQQPESSSQSQPETPEEPTVPVDPDSIIYLTFDDGPSSTSTGRILDILKENDVHATFFILNYSADKLPLLQRMIDEGHTIGLHAYDHEYDVCYSTDDAYLDGITKLRDKLQEDLGYQAFCLRFPGGSSNTISRHYNEGIMSRLAEQVPDLGMEYYDWNVDSGDANGNHIPDDTLVANTTSELRKGKSNIVLMHDTDAKQTTVQALQAIIDYGKENGYHFEAIDRDTPPVHHPINN